MQPGRVGTRRCQLLETAVLRCAADVCPTVALSKAAIRPHSREGLSVGCLVSSLPVGLVVPPLTLEPGPAIVCDHAKAIPLVVPVCSFVAITVARGIDALAVSFAVEELALETVDLLAVLGPLQTAATLCQAVPTTSRPCD